MPDSTTDNNPSISLNYIRVPSAILNIDPTSPNFKMTTNKTTINLEIAIANLEPEQIIDYFGIASTFIDNCNQKTIAMYSTDKLQIMNTTSNPEIDASFMRVPHPTFSIKPGESKLHYFLANINIKIINCEVNYVKTAYAKARDSILGQVSDALALMQQPET